MEKRKFEYPKLKTAPQIPFQESKRFLEKVTERVPGKVAENLFYICKAGQDDVQYDLWKSSEFIEQRYFDQNACKSHQKNVYQKQDYHKEFYQKNMQHEFESADFIPFSDELILNDHHHPVLPKDADSEETWIAFSRTQSIYDRKLSIIQKALTIYPQSEKLLCCYLTHLTDSTSLSRAELGEIFKYSMRNAASAHSVRLLYWKFLRNSFVLYTVQEDFSLHLDLIAQDADFIYSLIELLAYSGYREAVLFLYYFNLEPLDWMEERKKLLLNSELFEEIISEESLPFIEQMQIAKIKESFDKKMIKKKILQIDCMSRLLKQNPEISSKKKSNMELLFDQVIRSQSRENLILFVKTFPFNKGIPFITTIAIYF